MTGAVSRPNRGQPCPGSRSGCRASSSALPLPTAITCTLKPLFAAKAGSRCAKSPDCSVLVVAVPNMPAFEGLLDRLAAYGQPTSSLVLDDEELAAEETPEQREPEVEPDLGEFPE